MQTLVRKNCTGCHSASYALQHRFDEAGWSKILDLMKHVNVLGTYLPDRAPNPNIEFHKQQLAAYLARARGPGPTSMQFKLRPRPSGEAARVVFKEYDVPLESEEGLTNAYPLNDGSDWSLGTPSGMNGGLGVHDAQADFDGNLWFTYSHASREITVGRIDAKAGAFKPFKLPEAQGFAAQTHGITRDENGILWFNTRGVVARGHGGLARLDPKTERIDVFYPPAPMSGTAGTLDADGNSFVWVTSPDGALRFDTQKQTFTEFKSITYKNARGTATVYGLAADRKGNGWWALMTQDLVDTSEIETGKTLELQMPPEQAALGNLTPQQRKMYETFVPPDFNTPFAWAQGPRRLGADQNGDFVWIGNSFGGTMARIHIDTKEIKLVPLPNPHAHQPYQVSVDRKHNVWTNLWSTDKVAKYDPSTEQWTLFDLPNRGTETRHISLLERDDGSLQVILPYYRTRKIAVMTLRSEQELQALKNRVERQ
jgi:streptogramin lyase